ncbi:MAG TPA: methyltransferase domain-containing protein [Bryobacteraceae bacterium]|jgi:ubiquinone/menaquinone biosynthesis C-methylase UbiE|nr:methyltransferase domain-containing protein [Bryobacteraceae bacterium]
MYQGTAVAFDKIAADYGHLWNRTAIGSSQRRAVWRWTDPLFLPGDSVLDIGCGDGEDAVHLQARGVHVHGVDASPEMVKHARERGVRAEVLTAEDLDCMSGNFDGAISNFGVLNCLEDLEQLASNLRRLIRPGGYVALCIMGRCCAWETCHFLRRKELRKAFRRTSTASTTFGIDVRYPSTGRIRQAFRTGFSLVRWYGIGLLVPPSYIDGLSEATVLRLAKVDRRIAHWLLLRGLADHRLYLFQRV